MLDPSSGSIRKMAYSVREKLSYVKRKLRWRTFFTYAGFVEPFGERLLVLVE